MIKDKVSITRIGCIYIEHALDIAVYVDEKGNPYGKTENIDDETSSHSMEFLSPEHLHDSVIEYVKQYLPKDTEVRWEECDNE